MKTLDPALPANSRAGNWCLPDGNLGAAGAVDEGFGVVDGFFEGVIAQGDVVLAWGLDVVGYPRSQ
ncbi:hypothetical protein, partial [Arthrobacter wenxiniae]